ncbi:MAG: class I SAM-dependent methyltransferase [Myxococcales bacterium]
MIEPPPQTGGRSTPVEPHLWSGGAELYDAVRPAPPRELLDVLCRLCGEPRPSKVVDLGSGTGLSTRVWAGRAKRAVGIEPSEAMRRQAVRTPVRGVIYQPGTAAATGLRAGSADIVTCVQALHWCEPQSTFAEAARILRPGGVFAAVDCDWPPFVDWRLERPWAELVRRANRLVGQKKLLPGRRRWDKAGHLARLRESRRFRFVKELTFSSRTRGSALKLVRLAETQGELALLLRLGVPEILPQLEAFRRAAGRALGERVVSWSYSYRVRAAVL